MLFEWLGRRDRPGFFRTFNASILFAATAVLAGSPTTAAASPGAPPPWSLNQPIYEVNLQLFSQAGTYKELQKRLPKLKALGVGILWLMPITTRGQVKAFGSPYCVKDYKGFHAPYGSEQDFKDLVAAVHAAEMRIILDWVPNHSSWDNPLTVEHKDFYKLDAAGNIQQAYSWSDVAQLNYANPALRAWMIDALKHWVTRYDVDGFRMDVAWGVPEDFWAEAKTALDKVKPLYLLAESNNPKDQFSFSSNYDWDLMGIVDRPALVEISRGEKPLSLIDEILTRERRVYTAPFMRMRFTSNHDEFGNFGTPAQRLGNAMRPLAVLTATLPGKPLIYNGQEIGWNPGNRGAPIEWNDTSSFLDFYGRLFRLHQGNPALHSGAFARQKTTQDAAIYAFARWKDRDRVLVLLNLSGQAQSFALVNGEMAGAYSDLFTGKAAEVAGSVQISLGPWDYRVLVTGNALVGLAGSPRSEVRKNRRPSSYRASRNRAAMRTRFQRDGDGRAFDAVGIPIP